MRFTDETINRINEVLDSKKKDNPIASHHIDIGVKLDSSFGGTSAYKGNWQLCEVEEISRMIEELTMLKEAITEISGVIL